MASNSLLGKLSQSSDKVTTIAISSQTDLEMIMNDPLVEIKDFFVMGDRILQIDLKRHSAFNRLKLSQNVIIGAYITS